MLLCGAGGLLIADKIVFPGRYSRLQSLGIHGRVAAQIVIGAVLLFFVAAILEGGFRQLIQSTLWRYAIGWSIGTLWLALFRQGRATRGRLMARKKKAEPVRPFQLRGRNLRQIVTPEGVSLSVELADIGERVGRLHHRLGVLEPRRVPDLFPISYPARLRSQHRDRHRTDPVHRLPGAQTLFPAFRAGPARRDARQAHRRSARHRPARRAAARLGGDRAQSDARVRNLHAADRASVARRRRLAGLGAVARLRLDPGDRRHPLHQPRPDARRRPDRRHHRRLAAAAGASRRPGAERIPIQFRGPPAPGLRQL